jgi:hypothetical protein
MTLRSAFFLFFWGGGLWFAPYEPGIFGTLEIVAFLGLCVYGVVGIVKLITGW